MDTPITQLNEQNFATEEIAEEIIPEKKNRTKPLRLIIRAMSQESSSENELLQKIVELLGERAKVIIRIVPANTRSADAVFLHGKFGGLFLKDRSLVRVTIRGISKSPLEF